MLVDCEEVKRAKGKLAPTTRPFLEPSSSKKTPGQTLNQPTERLRPVSLPPPMAGSQSQPTFTGFGSMSTKNSSHVSTVGSSLPKNTQTPFPTPLKMEQQPVTGLSLATTQSQRPTIEVRHMSRSTLHNLLYYMYTGKVNLHIGQGQAYLCPIATEPFELYRKATKFGLDQLAARCLHYLRSTLTPMNVCGRLFNPWCLDYPALKHSYIDYLVRSFNVVSRRVEWCRFVLHAQNEESLEHEHHQHLLLEEIMARVERIRNNEN